MTTKNSSKLSNFFTCEFCNYNANRKCDFNKHINSLKHINNEILQNTTENSSKFSKKIINVNVVKYINTILVYIIIKKNVILSLQI